MEEGKWWRNSELGWGFVVRYDATRNECWKLCSPDGFMSQTRPDISFNSLELLILNMSGIENTTKLEVCVRRAEFWEIPFHVSQPFVGDLSGEQGSWGVNDHLYQIKSLLGQC